MFDVTKFVGDLHEYIERALRPVLDRLKALEAKHLQKGEKGDPGRDADPVTEDRLTAVVAGHLSRNPPQKGEKGDPGPAAPAVTEAQIAAAVQLHLKANPPAKGDPGRDADPVSDERVAGVVAAYLSRNPPAPGQKGDPGRDAEPISLAAVVRELLESDELKSLVELRTKEAASALPRPKDGRDADPVTEAQLAAAVTRHLQANPPAPGMKGDPGNPGADGQGLLGFLIDREGILVATTSKGEAVRLGQVVGKDGRDGVGFEDVEFDYDGERTVTAKFVRGGSVLKSVPWKFPVVIDRGYWKAGFKAEKGDGVTSEGTWWIALRATSVKPSTEATEDWRIGARKGRDGNPPPVKTDGA